MPVAKNAYLRYRIIDACLNARYRKFNANDLLERIYEKADIRISKATFDKDIAVMRLEFGAPIIFNRTDNCYAYSENFELNIPQLNDEDKRLLAISLSTLSLLKGTTFLKQYEQLIDKIQLSAYTSLEQTIIQVEVPTADCGSEYIERLVNAITNQQTCVIVHRGYDSSETKEHVISPYLIKEYRNRWYLIAWSAQRKRVLTFGMDRIQLLKNSDAPYYKDQAFNPEDYFKYSFGITRLSGTDPLDLVLKFNKRNSAYILSQPLHPTQVVLEQNDDALVIHIRAYESDELWLAVLSYGSGVEVISPATFRKKISQEFAAAAKIYKKDLKSKTSMV